MTEEEYKNKKDRWTDILNVWNVSHPDVSIAVGHATFLGITSTHVTMQWPDGSIISREISYIEYARCRDPEQYIIDTFDKMYKEGGKKDA